jgi:hypothetical protein
MSNVDMMPLYFFRLSLSQFFSAAHPQANTVGDGGNLCKVSRLTGRMHQGRNVSFRQRGHAYRIGLGSFVPMSRELVFDPGYPASETLS